MKNSDGWFEWIVKIISAEYNFAEHYWEYTLEDCRGNPIPGKIRETELGGSPITESEMNQ